MPFSRFILLAILMNVVFLSLEHYQQSDEISRTLEVANIVFVCIFTLEMLLKLVVYGIKGYFLDKFNAFDCLIIIVAFLELFLSYVGYEFTGLRALRLLRVVRVIQNVPSLRRLVTTILGSISGVLYMTALMAIFIFMFAVLGMQLFGNVTNQSSDDIANLEGAQFGFTNILWASITVFQVITLDSWFVILAEVARLSTLYETSLLYFIVVVSFGYFILFNLFIAVLLQQFTDVKVSEIGILASSAADRLALQSLNETTNKLLKKSQLDESKVKHILKKTIRETKQRRRRKRKEKAQKIKQQRTLKLKHILDGKSCGIFSRYSTIRRFCSAITVHKAFEPFVLFIVLCTCVILGYENPTTLSNPSTVTFIFVTDIIFAAFFFIEMVIKMIACGVWSSRGDTAYLKNKFNVLDSIVVAFSILSLLFPALSVLRVTRALRPVRLMARSSKIKVVLVSLLHALPAIGNVILFWLFLTLMFGICGVNFFKGKLYTCNDSNIEYEIDCVGTFETTVLQDGVLSNETMDREWSNPHGYNFDNTYTACSTLVQVATLSNWGEIMYSTIDSTEPGKSSITRNNPTVIIFFVLYVVVGSFFAFNLFVGVVIDNFQRLKSRMDGSAFLTSTQKKWVNTKQLLTEVSLSPHPFPRSQSRLSLLCFSIVEHQYFDSFIMSCILLNTIFMCFQHFNQPEWVGILLEVSNIVFVITFTIEAFCKINAYGLLIYFHEQWNKFDFTIAVISLVALFVDTPFATSIFRLLRIGRIFRIIKRARNLQKLFQTLIFSLPSLWNIGSLLFVVFYVYAVSGVYLFGNKADQTLTTENSIDSLRANFNTIFSSLLTLFRVATGDGWEVVKNNILFQCQNGMILRSTTGCNEYVVSLYFISFYIVGASVFLQLFLAVILENFGTATEQDSHREIFEKILKWRKTWQEFDPNATSAIPASIVEYFFGIADPPFGFGQILPRSQFLARIAILNLRVEMKTLSKKDTIIRLQTIRACLQKNFHKIPAGYITSEEHSPITSENDDDKLTLKKIDKIEDIEEIIDKIMDKIEHKLKKHSSMWCVTFKDTLTKLAHFVADFDIETEEPEPKQTGQSEVENSNRSSNSGDDALKRQDTLTSDQIITAKASMLIDDEFDDHQTMYLNEFFTDTFFSNNNGNMNSDSSSGDGDHTINAEELLRELSDLSNDSISEQTELSISSVPNRQQSLARSRSSKFRRNRNWWQFQMHYLFHKLKKTSCWKALMIFCINHNHFVRNYLHRKKLRQMSARRSRFRMRQPSFNVGRNSGPHFSRWSGTGINTNTKTLSKSASKQNKMSICESIEEVELS